MEGNTAWCETCEGSFPTCLRCGGIICQPEHLATKRKVLSVFSVLESHDRFVRVDICHCGNPGRVAVSVPDKTLTRGLER